MLNTSGHGVPLSAFTSVGIRPPYASGQSATFRREKNFSGQLSNLGGTEGEREMRKGIHITNFG